jgi:hypothetical protein
LIKPFWLFNCVVQIKGQVCLAEQLAILLIQPGDRYVQRLLAGNPASGVVDLSGLERRDASLVSLPPRLLSKSPVST